MLGAVLVDTLEATLKDREVALHRVRVGILADILASAMLDGNVLRKVTANLAVEAAVVGHQPRLMADVLAHDRRDAFHRGMDL